MSDFVAQSHKPSVSADSDAEDRPVRANGPELVAQSHKPTVGEVLAKALDGEIGRASCRERV